MTPPEPDRASGVLVCLDVTTLKKRSDFLAAARAKRQVTPGFILQAKKRGCDAPGVRVGYTCSKKVGNAVQRNRAKRRLRAVARARIVALGQPGWDYVLIGRHKVTATRPFEAMLADLQTALARIHGPAQ